MILLPGNRLVHLCRREEGRERESNESLTESRWPRWASLLVPGFQIGDATSRLGNRYKEAWRREIQRCSRAYDERARDFEESNVTGRLSSLPYPPSLSSLRHLTRKFGIEGEANRSLSLFQPFAQHGGDHRGIRLGILTRIRVESTAYCNQSPPPPRYKCLANRFCETEEKFKRGNEEETTTYIYIYIYMWRGDGVGK